VLHLSGVATKKKTFLIFFNFFFDIPACRHRVSWYCCSCPARRRSRASSACSASACSVAGRVHPLLNRLPITCKEAFSYSCMRPSAKSEWGLKQLVRGVLNY
jgi:hypothetical protein